MQTVHGTAIALGDKGALIRGPSGSGKSDLALRCLSMGVSTILAKPAQLVSDDRVVIRVEQEGLVMSTPAAIAGMLEVRGIGIVCVATGLEARLSLVVDLEASSHAIERLPPPQSIEIYGHVVPAIRLYPFEASAPLKLLLALQGAE